MCGRQDQRGDVAQAARRCGLPIQRRRLCEMSEITLGVTGMTCRDCAHQVERALESVPGGERIKGAYPEAIARIESPTAIALDALNRALPKPHALSPLPTQCQPRV